MKRVGTVILAYILLLLIALLPAQRIDAPAAFRSRLGGSPRGEGKGEVRALWVIRHTLSSPDAIRQLVERARANGITDLIVQVRGRGDAYYDSPYEPRAEELDGEPPSYDPLKTVIAEAHRQGLRVHAWLNTYLVADIDILPESKNHLIYQHPEWLMIPRGLASELYPMDPQSSRYFERIVSYVRENPSKLEGLFISPANRDVRRRLLDLWLDVAKRYEVDGLHFDYVRYPNPEYDYSRASLDQFRGEIEQALPQEKRGDLIARVEANPLVYAQTYPNEYAEFQRRQVNLLVENIYNQVKQIRPSIKISAAVFANEEDASRSRYQNWREWLQKGWLDAVCPMAYTSNNDTYRRQIETAIALAAGREVWSGIGAYRQPVDGSREKIILSRKLGARGFILFSYSSLTQISDTNPSGDYLERLRTVINAE